MMVQWENFKLWCSQYKVEIRRSAISVLLIVSALLTERTQLVLPILIGTAIMFLAMKFGGKYQALGQSMIAGEAKRKKKDEERVPEDENGHPIDD